MKKTTYICDFCKNEEREIIAEEVGEGFYLSSTTDDMQKEFTTVIVHIHSEKLKTEDICLSCAIKILKDFIKLLEARNDSKRT